MAIKIAKLPDNPAGHASFVELFRVEIGLLSALKHRSITSIYDQGTLPDGSPYFVMEWLEGRGLDSILFSEGRLPVRIALLIARQIAGALGASHTVGYLHRDVKPANVLVLDQKVAGPWIVKLLDFGIAEKLSDETGMTKGGDFFGSVGYMSPEQLRAKPLSPASDVWQLGVTLYQMLTGSLPFEFRDTFETFTAILDADLKVPSEANLPDTVSALLVRLLAKDPESRPANGIKALEEIERLERDLGSEITAGFTKSDPLSKRVDSPMFTSRVPTAPLQGRPAFQRPTLLFFGGCCAVGFVTLIFILRNHTRAGGSPWFGISTGVCLAGAGVCFGTAIRRLLASRRSDISGRAQDILSGARTRDQLSRTLAITVDDIASKCRLVDEKFLAMTMAVMVDEYGASSTFDDRQKALMNAVTLLEKLMAKLSPWYIRYDKLIALVVTIVGVLSGLVTIAQNVSKLIKGN